MKYPALAAALLALCAVPAAAQERGVNRRQYTFLDNDITIEVMADMPGVLQVVRGEPGLLDVAARVEGGMSAFALGGREGDKLRLSAVGGHRADFIVVVPEDVYLRVHLPNRKGGELGSARPGATYSWGGAAPPASNAAILAPPTGPTVAHVSEHAPRMLSIPRLTAVRSVSVRMQSSTFSIAGNHYMTVVNGGSQNVEVRTGDSVDELIVTVPSGTRDFVLKLAGRTALQIRGNEVTPYCQPLTEQELGGGVHWFTFVPEAGRLTCH